MKVTQKNVAPIKKTLPMKSVQWMKMKTILAQRKIAHKKNQNRIIIQMKILFQMMKIL